MNRRATLALLAISAVLMTVDVGRAQTRPAPPAEVTAVDEPNDVGKTLKVSWSLSPDDVSSSTNGVFVTGYDVMRQVEGDRDFTSVGEVSKQTNEFLDRTTEPGTRYRYRVVAIAGETRSEASTMSEFATPVVQWVNRGRIWLALFTIVICGAVGGYIIAARRGRELYIRPIPGLEAVDEAVGRATEMGRSVLFIPGIQDINDIQTVAGLTVLSRVSTLTAEYGAHLEVPTSKSLVMTTARETVAASYLAAGRPDAYREDDIYYLTNEQFGYVAAVTATMVEEEPAACFYMGAFFAESLILAETGNAVGAIQVAGTAQPSQLPFFVAACDYTLIGEEFFAASAYLSGEPVQLGSLRGQDVGKVIAAALIVIGCGLASWLGPKHNSVTLLTEYMLGSKGFLP